MSNIYSMFRKFIGDDVTDYSMPDLEVLKFLDNGIDKLSQVIDKRTIEEITIESADISNGYIDLTNNCNSLIYTSLPYEGVYWGLEGEKRITFWDTEYISEGTYEFNYSTNFNRFDGQLRDESYFNHDRRADLGIVFWALAEYQMTNGIIDVDGERKAVVSKSEEGISESFSSSESVEFSSPTALRKEAMRIFDSLNSKRNIIFAVTV